MPGFSYEMNWRRPHLVLADAGDVDRVRADDLAQPLDHVLRGERAVGRLLVAQRVALAQVVELAPPVGRGRPGARPACSAVTAAISSSMTCRASPTIGTSAARFLPISAGSMSACTIVASGAKRVQLAGDPVVEAGAQRDDQVGLLQAVDRGDRAVHAGHAQVLRVRVGERAARHQRGDHRDAGQLGQPAQPVGGAGLEHAAADVEHRPAGAGHQPGRLADLLAVRVQGRAGSRAGPASAARRRWSAPAARPWGCRPAPGRAGRCAARWNASASTRGISSAVCTRKLCLVIGRVMPWMSASWKASVPIDGRGHLAGDRHHRHRVHVRVGDRGDQVRRARAGGGHADADLAGGLGVAGGGVPGALLVADQDVPDRGVVERVVRRQDRAARDAEDDLDAERLERPHERAGAGDLAEPVSYRGGRPRRPRPAVGRRRSAGSARPGPPGGVGEGLWRGSRHGGSGLRLEWLVLSKRCDAARLPVADGSDGNKNGPRADARGQRTLRQRRVRSGKYSQRPGRRHAVKPDASHAMSQLIPHAWLTDVGFTRRAVRPRRCGPRGPSAPPAPC